MSMIYEKCKVMHFDRNNTEHKYSMKLKEGESNHVIEKTLAERDLGLMIAKD